jgi:hypothetical protein
VPANVKALLAATSMVLLVSPPIWATLGKPAASIAGDQRRLGGEVRISSAAGFAVHEISASDGTIVREYASPAGEVFGVSWRGPTRPNLIELLGDHYPAFQQASRSPGRRRGPLVVRTEHLVVEMGGHIRDFHGRAYLPDRLPASVPPAAVR